MIRTNIFGLQPGSKENVGFNDHVKKYIEVVKKQTGLEIALSFYGDFFLKYSEDPKVPCKL